MGLCNLKELGAQGSLVEGDSKVVVQWGLVLPPDSWH